MKVAADGRGRLLLILFAALFVEQAAMLVPAAKRTAFPAREDAAIRGLRIAQGLGCFSCHGAEGARGVANPGSKDGRVPALAGGEMMMWAHDEGEMRSWILDGRPRAHAPGADDERPKQALRMPAYRGVVSEAQLDDLVAYLKSISGLQFPDDDVAARGLERMHDLGCFRCHGPMGVGGVSNPRSLKGYVPGFGGEDYSELVRGGDELRQWIDNGVSDRFARSPLAHKFVERQLLKMPAYGTLVADGELDQVAAAVEWLASDRWRAIPVP
jgi:mono/diheme cytochrome c family protein